jgi:hypothetical protein
MAPTYDSRKNYFYSRWSLIPTFGRKELLMARRISGDEDHFLEMSVSNIGFLLDRLGQDCHPLQFLRELTQNSIEAIQRTGGSGEIVWDVDWVSFDFGIRKLCITDTGDGMTGEEMVRFINQLSSSVSEQSFSGNYGVGAKIAAATRNTAGVIYLSWKDGEGSMIELFRDNKRGQYGLKQFEHADGTFAHFLPLEDSARPDIIVTHGTRVVLKGKSETEDTMQAPEGTSSPSRWISKYLNSRYYRFPEGITVKAREGWEYPRTDRDRNYLRTLNGQKKYLDDHSLSSGKVSLTDAIAHWWILRDEPAITNNSGYIESSGHVAALYGDELYEHSTSRAGMSRLQQFGVTFGYRYVVIYVEPVTKRSKNLTTNTSRTLLLLNNESLPWADWAAEFRDKLPREIAALVAEKAAAAAEEDHSKSIKERLKDILDIYKVSRYKPSPSGDVFVDDTELTRGGTPRNIGTATRRSKGSEGAGGGPLGNVYAAFEKTDGVPAKKTRPDVFPEVRWVTTKNGTREPGDIEDRAAKYLRDQNLLLINADFRVFVDMVNHFVREFGGTSDVENVVREAVHTWFEQALTETVIGIQGLEGSREWAQNDIDTAVSEESLTTAVMQRYHVMFAVKRELGAKMGSRKKRAG